MGQRSAREELGWLALVPLVLLAVLVGTCSEGAKPADAAQPGASPLPAR
ncbi:MAG: hypothetical protein IT377_26800 [Polyangiaceae bacterium]|nr:hypothetical protein [Polyangiaceae bacterium]